MIDRDCLLSAILESPADDLPRLVCADWLEENGEPERAEFIRVQIEIVRLEAIVSRWSKTPSNKKGGAAGDGAEAGAALAKAQNMQARERELWTPPLNRDWIKSLPMLATLLIGNDQPSRGMLTWGFISRGFVSSITLPRSALLHLPSILRTQPIERITCEGVEFAIDKPHIWDTESHCGYRSRWRCTWSSGLATDWPTRSALCNGIAGWINSTLPIQPSTTSYQATLRIGDGPPIPNS